MRRRCEAFRAAPDFPGVKNAGGRVEGYAASARAETGRAFCGAMTILPLGSARTTATARARKVWNLAISRQTRAFTRCEIIFGDTPVHAWAKVRLAASNVRKRRSAHGQLQSLRRRGSGGQLLLLISESEGYCPAYFRVRRRFWPSPIWCASAERAFAYAGATIG